VLTAGDVANRALGHPQTIGNLELGFRPQTRPDSLGLLVCEMTLWAYPVLWLRSVDGAIGKIFSLRLPGQVTRIYTAEVAIPATVGGAMSRGRWISVHKLAHESVCVSAPAFMSEPSSAVLVKKVRPS
jgi:hypothetical protein